MRIFSQCRNTKTKRARPTSRSLSYNNNARPKKIKIVLKVEKQ